MLKRSAAQQELNPAPAMHQEGQLKIEYVGIGYLCEHRDRFNIHPAYQREDCWTRIQDQRLIETILRGLGIGLFEGYKYHVGGRRYWEMLDGHNRLSAILRFYDGEYKTWSAAIKKKVQPVSKFGPLAPLQDYPQLAQYLKDYFYDYQLAVQDTPEMTAEERAARFLDIQCQTPLTPAEKLGVCPSKANATARLIAQHPFWEDFYEGRAGRKQVFLSSLYLIGLQITPGGIVDLRQGPFVPLLASGKYDDKITDDLIQIMQRRLDNVACAYAGMQFTDRAAVIAMYQSIMKLEQAGCTIEPSIHKYKLTDWLLTILAASKHSLGLPAYQRPIQNLLFASGQKLFWEKHEKTVLALFGIKPERGWNTHQEYIENVARAYQERHE